MSTKTESTVTINRDGKEYFGRYRADRGLLTVSSTYRTKTTQVISPGSDPIPLAEMLLREIIKRTLRSRLPLLAPSLIHPHPYFNSSSPNTVWKSGVNLVDRVNCHGDFFLYSSILKCAVQYDVSNSNHVFRIEWAECIWPSNVHHKPRQKYSLFFHKIQPSIYSLLKPTLVAWL